MTHSVKPMNLNSLVLPRLGRGYAPEQQTRHHSKNVKSKKQKPNTKKLSDPRLVEACLNGDQAAWNELVERYQRLVYSIPRRYRLAAADAEDVMQNVFVIVFRRLATLRDYSLLSAWLIRITKRETLHQLSRGAHQVDLETDLESTDELPAEQFQHLEAQVAVRQALEQLDDSCRAMLELFLSKENPTYQEAAACLGCPVGSIGPTRARCFKKLEAILREMEVDVLA